MMTRPVNKVLRTTATVLMVAMTASACGAGSGAGPAQGGGDTISISGSSTVEPISARVGAAFRAANPAVGVTVEGPGTGDGFKRFCAGETDISDASRAIKDSEAEACASAGVEYVELKVAFDGITVLTSPANKAVSCLDFGDLYALVGPESEGFASWSDANVLASDVGGKGGFPDAPLIVTAPGEESGTYDTFVELVIDPLAEERGAEPATRADYQSSPNDNVIVQNITGNDTSFGWVGYAFFAENRDVLKAIAVDGGSGCVEPSDATIGDGSYPLSRPLFIYVSLTKLAAKPALGSFVDYYMSDEGLASVSAAGYVNLPADQAAATM
ncbi:MAG: phosphate ABC transporter substrate-binding protein PstS family protein, partial [Acidimicrobiia bacterium]|nr:phosphate ABC transporter substrate-binding protein PstS family protein [Acidimicrobiia bacterium]